MRIRRHDILQDTPTVKERVLYSLGEEALVSLDIRLAEPYEGDLPVPVELEHGNILIAILHASRSGENGPLRAVGYTAENAGVNIIIPKDETRQSTLSLLDLKNRRASRRRAKSNH